MRRRCSIACIIPPVLLEELARRGQPRGAGRGAAHPLVYRRDSIDDQGMPLHGWVHDGRDYDNAFWDGEEMVFGDGEHELDENLRALIDRLERDAAPEAGQP